MEIEDKSQGGFLFPPNFYRSMPWIWRCRVTIAMFMARLGLIRSRVVRIDGGAQ